MQRIAMVCLGGLAFFMVAAQPALANGSFRSSVTGAQNLFEPLAGVGGAAPWIVDEGRARIRSYGRVVVRVEGLVLGGDNYPSDDPALGPLEGTTAGVRSITASVACFIEGSHAVVATTEAAPLSEDGDARIRDHVDLPEECVAPIVLVRIGDDGGDGQFNGLWIAASGL